MHNPRACVILSFVPSLRKERIPIHRRKNKNTGKIILLSVLILAILAFAGTMLYRVGAGVGRAAQQPGTTVPAPEPTYEPAPEPTYEPSPEPTPEPTPEPVRELTLTGSGPAEIHALADYPELEYVDARACTDYEELALAQRQLPQVRIEYEVPLGEGSVSSLATELVLDDPAVTAEELMEKLAWLPRLQKLDLLALDYGNAVWGPLVEAYPELDVLWTVRVLGEAVRSDLSCYSTLQPWPVTHRYSDAQLYALLHYCKHLVALDIGHNDIRDLTPIGELKELKVLIIGDNPYISDISPLGKLENLEYMEMFLANNVSDFSALANMTHMVDLCVGYCPGLKDLSFVENMPDLKMGWFANDPIPAEQQEAVRASHPDTTFLFRPSRVSSTSDGWRMTERNVAIRQAFLNWRAVEQFRAWDDVDYREGAEIHETYPLEN